MIDIRPASMIISLTALTLGSATFGSATLAQATPSAGEQHASTVTGRNTGSPSSARTTPASTGSMVYLKDHNVFVARHERILRMTAAGRVLDVLDPKPLKNSAGQSMDGTPSDVAISPDGRIIAYTFALYGCPSGLSCDTRFATAYTDATRLSDPATRGTTYYDAPSWITNSRTVTGGGSFAEVNVHDLGRAPLHWFRDSEISSPARDLTEPAVSRDRGWVATIRSWGSTTSVLWSRVNGDLTSGQPALPTPWCETNEEPGLAGPAFSATSDRLAWTRADGIWMKDAPGDCGVQPRLVLPGAKEASFSLASFATTPAAPVSTSRPTVRGKVKVKKTVTVDPGRWSPAATRYAYQWYTNSTALKGATKASYKIDKHDRGKKLWVRVTASNAGGSGRADATAGKVR